MNQEEDLQTVLNIIKDETGVTVNEMQSNSRMREIVWGRYMFASIAEKYLYWSDMQVYMFVKKDRTSLIHAHYKHNQFLENKDKDYCGIYQRIISRIAHDLTPQMPAVPLTEKQMKSVRMLNIGMLIGLDMSEKKYYDKCLVD